MPHPRKRPKRKAGGSSGSDLNGAYDFFGYCASLVAAVLLWFTKKLSDSTSEYSRQVQAQTGIMSENQRLSAKTLEIEEKNRQRERLIKEMDALIGPLYSRLTDQQIFNAVDVSTRHGTISGEQDVLGYEASAFWQDINRHKYLSSPSLKADLEAYLEVKMGYLNCPNSRTKTVLNTKD